MKKLQMLALLFFMVNSVHVFSINFRGAGKSVQTLCRSFQNKQVARNCSSSKKDPSSDNNSHEVVIMLTPILILTGYLCYGEGRSRGYYEGNNDGYRNGYGDGKTDGFKLAKKSEQRT